MPNSGDGTINMQWMNAQIQMMCDEHFSDQLEKLTQEEQEIEKRMIDIRTLLKEFDTLKDTAEQKGSVSLDSYRDIIERFQNEHFPNICEENKSLITENLNPFPEGFPIDNVNKDQLAHCIDNLYMLAEQEQNALTRTSRHLQQKTENHYQTSLMTAHGSSRKGMAERAVENQTQR